MKNWSAQISERYAVNLPADLRAWFDDEVWKEPGGAEFNQPLTPQQLLEPEPGFIWGGFMLPDSLPVLGNEYGDWLCLRVDEHNTVSDVIYWCHGGGDWIPYGATFAEAVLYDAAFRVIYDRRPEFVEPEPAGRQVFRLAQWALDWIDTDPRELTFWKHDGRHADPLPGLLNAGVAQVSTHRDLILKHLQSELKTRSNPDVARQIDIPWEPDFVSWIFDTALLPELRRDQLSRRWNVPAEKLIVQDWESAEREALKVAALRSDLGWPFDIAGWAAERRGDVSAAIELYLQGVHASLFSDDAIRFRSHWFADGFAKFSAARLFELREALAGELRDDPYLNLFWANDPETLRDRSRDFWLSAALAAQRAHDHAAAYQSFYLAGWDVGLQHLDHYAEILDGLINSAQAANWPGRAAVAQLHRQSLR